MTSAEAFLPSGMQHPNHQAVAGQAAPGWLGLWHGQSPQDDEYAFKYSGGLGTYCAKHQSQAVYCPEQQTTWFVVGGALPCSESRDLTIEPGMHQPRSTLCGPQQLYYLIGCFDHRTKLLSRPTIIYDKWCGDPHDNPVLTIDPQGYLWVYGPSHGQYTTESFISRSVRPYDHRAFTHQHVDLFAYPQPWWNQHGCHLFFTSYSNHQRGLWFSRGPTPLQSDLALPIAHIERGNYQISCERDGRVATMFDMHPQNGGLEARRNIYYLESRDGGTNWHNVHGEPVTLPVQSEDNPALVLSTRANGDLVYLKDLQFDQAGQPCLLYITSRDNLSGPAGGDRQWWFARFDGQQFHHHRLTTSDHNYDMGELALQADGSWRLLAPTITGPQAWNTGGELALWAAGPAGDDWHQLRQVTANSTNNHGFCRRPLRAHDDFAWFWADGDARRPSRCHFYFADMTGQAYRMPSTASAQWCQPEMLSAEKGE